MATRTFRRALAPCVVAHACMPKAVSVSASQTALCQIALHDSGRTHARNSTEPAARHARRIAHGKHTQILRRGCTNLDGRRHGRQGPVGRRHERQRTSLHSRLALRVFFFLRKKHTKEEHPFPRAFLPIEISAWRRCARPWTLLCGRGTRRACICVHYMCMCRGVFESWFLPGASMNCIAVQSKSCTFAWVVSCACAGCYFMSVRDNAFHIWVCVRARDARGACVPPDARTGVCAQGLYVWGPLRAGPLPRNAAGQWRRQLPGIISIIDAARRHGLARAEPQRQSRAAA